LGFLILFIWLVQKRPDIFLSTDDRLLKTARRHEHQLKVAIRNPVVWLIEVLQEQ
jgi:hypothetical protein